MDSKQLVRQLEELSADVAASGEALAELEIGADVVAKASDAVIAKTEPTESTASADVSAALT